MTDQANRRRSERVILRMGVLVIAENEERKQIEEEAETQVVNAHGGLLRMKEHLHIGQSFLLSNPRNSMEISCAAWCGRKRPVWNTITWRLNLTARRRTSGLSCFRQRIGEFLGRIRVGASEVR
jgi:hypothetical protein